MGSVVLPHLESGWHVDQAILSEDERLVVIRFGRDGNPDCMRQDEVLYKIAEKVKNFAVIYVCDIDRVPDFNTMYELYDPCTVMFFFVSGLGSLPFLALAPSCPFSPFSPFFRVTLGGPPTDFLLRCAAQQTHHVRSRDGKQQQALVRPRGQAGAHRHHRDDLPGRQEGPWSGRQPQRLLYEIPILVDDAHLNNANALSRASFAKSKSAA